MTDLRTAAQQALEALTSRDGDGWTRRFARDRAIEALEAALAEPVQEPVAWRFKAMIGMPWSLSDDGYYISCKRDQRYFVEALYTAPPHRKPLTEEEMRDLWSWAMTAEAERTATTQQHAFARAIERAHGITP